MGSDDDMDRLLAQARRATLATATVLASTSIAALGARLAPELAPVARPLARVLLGVGVVIAAWAVFAAGRPIQRRTGFDTDFMVGRVWLVGGFALLLPIGLIALPLGVWHLRARSIGGYQTIKDGGGGRYYPEIALSHGEGRPLGVLFLVLGTLWPAAVACVLLGG